MTQNRKYPYLIVTLLALLNSPLIQLGPWTALVMYFVVGYALSCSGRNGLFPKTEMKCLCSVFMACVIQSVLVNMMHDESMMYVSRGVSTALNAIAIIYFSYKMTARYGRSAFDYIVDAMLLSYSVTVGIAISMYGVMPVLNSVTAVFATGITGVNDMETQEVLEQCHQILLILPIVAILLLHSYVETKDRKTLYRLILSAVFSFMAFKRIAIGAGIVMFLVTMLYRFYNKGLIRLSGIVAITVLLGYIYLIHSGLIYQLAYQYDINLMFRDRLWPAFDNQYSMDWDFIGKGYGFTSKYLHMNNVRMYGVAIGGVHNDILKTYIDLGFMPTIFYFLFFIVYVPIRFLRTMNKDVSFMFWSIQLYLTIIYLTDNAMIYECCQLVAYTAPFCLTISPILKDS